MTRLWRCSPRSSRSTRAKNKGRGVTGEAGWIAIDDYIVDRLLGPDPALDATLVANEAAGLPPIDVSAALGKMLHLFARMANARRVLEIGTLGGYSTIWLARAVGDGGMVVTLELDPHHAAVASDNFAAAGLASRIGLRTGPAIGTLHAMTDEPPFDLIFIDADKQNNVAYLDAAVRLSRPGTTIVVDNVIREGGVLDASSDDERIIGTRALFDAVAAHPRLSAIAIQTVGAKNWDGFLLAVVQGDA